MANIFGEFVSTKEQEPSVLWISDPLTGRRVWIDSGRYRPAARPPVATGLSVFRFCVHSQGTRIILTANSALNSLVNLFVSRVSNLREVERIFWKVENKRVRVWTVMNQPNLPIENQIYDAQLDLMDMFPDMSFDFAVIFRREKSPNQISPEEATQVFLRV